MTFQACSIAQIWISPSQLWDCHLVSFLTVLLPVPICTFSQFITSSLFSQSSYHKLIFASSCVHPCRVTCWNMMKTRKSEILLNEATKQHQVLTRDHRFWLAKLAAMTKILTVGNLLYNTWVDLIHFNEALTNCSAESNWVNERFTGKI